MFILKYLVNTVLLNHNCFFNLIYNFCRRLIEHVMHSFCRNICVKSFHWGKLGSVIEYLFFNFDTDGSLSPPSWFKFIILESGTGNVVWSDPTPEMAVRDPPRLRWRSWQKSDPGRYSTAIRMFSEKRSGSFFGKKSRQIIPSTFIPFQYLTHQLISVL